MPKKKSDTVLNSPLPKKKMTKKPEVQYFKSVDQFKKSIKDGPFFICVVCNRCLYKKSVYYFKREKYSMPDSVFCLVASFNGLFYICKTCDGKLLHKKIPCQSVYYKLQIQNLPKHFQDIRRLEKVLVSKRILFKKVTIMPKGQALN